METADMTRRRGGDTGRDPRATQGIARVIGSEGGCWVGTRSATEGAPRGMSLPGTGRAAPSVAVGAVGPGG